MSQNIKLPKNAIPNRYEIDLDIDLENFKYAGKETIYIEVEIGRASCRERV